MIKKINEWLDAPFTWRSYFKACGACFIIGMISTIAWYVAIGVIKIDNLFKNNEEKPEE